MRTWVVVVALLGACKKTEEARPPQPMVAPGSAAVAAPPPTPADAALPDAAVSPDAAPIDPDTIMDTETIGPLRIGMTEAQVTKLLGAPDDKPPSIEEGATGMFVTDWYWKGKGVALGMAGEKRIGPFQVRSISVGAPSRFATSRGIHIGSTVTEIARAYPRSDEGSDDPTLYLVGSVYGGLLFKLEKDAVAEIFLGAMAF